MEEEGLFQRLLETVSEIYCVLIVRLIPYQESETSRLLLEVQGLEACIKDNSEIPGLSVNLNSKLKYQIQHLNEVNEVLGPWLDIRLSSCRVYQLKKLKE